MEEIEPSLASVVAKTTVVHGVTYFLVGLVASTLLDYSSWFEQPELGSLMRPLTDRWVMAGPLLQPLRGALFGLVFYQLRARFFAASRGWVEMWIILLVLGVVNVFGPTPGSIEGLIYTRLPLVEHLRGLPEVIVQSFAIAWGTSCWVRHSTKGWTWLMGVAFFISVALPALGLALGGAR